MQPDKLLYWESQEAGTMTCGCHCLNNLLQGPYCNDAELSQIAITLDNTEKFLLEGKQKNKNSHNISDTGDYSIQVLMEALYTKGVKSVVAVDEVYLVSNDVTKETGFVCHSSAHWFAVRKVSGVWFKLNSLCKRPYRISEFYLSAYMASIISEHSIVFLVKGGLGDPIKDPTVQLNPNQTYLDIDAVEEYNPNKMHRSGYKSKTNTEAYTDISEKEEQKISKMNAKNYEVKGVFCDSKTGQKNVIMMDIDTKKTIKMDILDENTAIMGEQVFKLNNPAIMEMFPQKNEAANSSKAKKECEIDEALKMSKTVSYTHLTLPTIYSV
eukprot:TRINITY_DN1160_c0_g1_i15.p1 TRINITY_DN1160_c0_g1~~TRINITY_DN1160_c0_g1_i15.p1  ORF type:complete len:325 (-),score=58.59 TRINITY_DN1160_c0_g1_i15:43-1017(-)